MGVGVEGKSLHSLYSWQIISLKWPLYFLKSNKDEFVTSLMGDTSV